MANSSTVAYQTIIQFSEQLIFYTSYICLICGFIGNTFNIIIFACLKVFRGNQSAYYLTIESFVDYFVLLNVFVSRIYKYGYNINLMSHSLMSCKILAATLQISIMTSLTTICCSVVDQYLVTSHQITQRQMSTSKLSQRLMFLNIAVWSIHSIPFGIFYEITPLNRCDISNQFFRLYFSIVYLALLNGVLPLVVSSVFSALAYRNVRRIVRRQVPLVRRRLDKQMTAMILIRVTFLVSVSIPFGLYLIYSINVPTNTADTFSSIIDILLWSITSSLFYVNYSGSFYLFLITSRRFRGQAKHVFEIKFWKKIFFKKRSDIVVPFNPANPISHISSHD